MYRYYKGSTVIQVPGGKSPRVESHHGGEGEGSPAFLDWLGTGFGGFDGHTKSLIVCFSVFEG